jgi:hypothetical protein
MPESTTQYVAFLIITDAHVCGDLDFGMTLKIDPHLYLLIEIHDGDGLVIEIEQFDKGNLYFASSVTELGHALREILGRGEILLRDG